MVLLVLAQMLGEAVDALGQEGDLDLGGSGVLDGLAEALGDLALSVDGHGHGGDTLAAA
jgi:hypothetical protein